MKHLRVMCALFVSASLISAAAGQQPQEVREPQLQAAEAEAEAAEPGGLSVEGIFLFPSSYVFRGYITEEDHFLFQPEVTLSHPLAVGETEISAYLNVWANFTDAPSEGEPEWFNELDLTLGAEIPLPYDLTLGIEYIYYNSPANFFDDIHELGVTLGHEDVLNPSIGIYRELDNDNGEENTYIELSVTPGFDVPEVENLRLDFPLVLGLTPDEYYTDSDGDGSVFGYASATIDATYAMSDNWSLLAGIDYIQMLSDSAEESNEGDEYQVVGRVGVGFSY